MACLSQSLLGLILMHEIICCFGCSNFSGGAFINLFISFRMKVLVISYLCNYVNILVNNSLLSINYNRMKSLKITFHFIPDKTNPLVFKTGKQKTRWVGVCLLYVCIYVELS